MTSLILDQALIEKLKAVETSVAVRDASGNLVGFFHPAATPETVDQYECPVSDDELLRRAQESGGRPLADILRDLEAQS
jgi:hypothetical protein